MGAVLVVATLGAVVQCTTDDDDDGQAFCEKLRTIADLDERLSLDDVGMRTAADELAALERLAPEAIVAEVTTLRQAAEAMYAEASDATSDRQVAEPLRGDIPAIDTASARLSAYAAQECSVVLDAEAPAIEHTEPTTTPPTEPNADTDL